MLIVDKNSVSATIDKLLDADKIEDAFNNVKKMLEIKKTILWRAEAGTCCGSLSETSSFLARETDILENISTALEERNIQEAIQLLKEYKRILETNHEPAQPKYH